MIGKSLRFLVALVVVSVLSIPFYGFDPGDVEKHSCLLQKYYESDCSEFVGEGKGEAKNVILIIGDGMGIGQTFAGRVFVNGPDNPFSWETLQHRGLVVTCSIRGITDSAASGTAMATGRKTSNSTISMDEKGQESYTTLMEQVKPYKATGLVTTTNLWDATPAVWAAHASRRSKAFEIAEQMIETARPEVMMGGGRDEFEGGGLGPDLIARARELGYTVVDDKNELMSINPARTKRLLGLFSGGKMPFEADREQNSRLPHLSDMAAKALEVLEQDERGFFLMIEGARIDHACHKTDMERLVHEMAEFDKTVELVMAWAKEHPDTLVVITADHETGGIKVLRGDYEKGDKIKVRWTAALLPGYAGHSSQMVPIYAKGPNAGAVDEEMDNTGVYCIMRNAFDAPLD